MKMQRIFRTASLAVFLIGRWYICVLLTISSFRFWNEFFRPSLNLDTSVVADMVDTSIVADMVSVKN